MKLYVLGVGPGDQELITLKAYNLLKRIPLIFYPTGGKETLALSIIESLLPNAEKILVELYFPMQKGYLAKNWREISDKIALYLRKEKEGIFLTLGDPAFYCTFYYLAEFLIGLGIEIEVVPGISSFSLASAKFLLPLTLGDEQAIILPAEKLLATPELCAHFSTLILMKVHRYIREIIEFSKKYNFLCYLAKRVGQREEMLIANLKDLPKIELDYFTLAILKRIGE